MFLILRRSWGSEANTRLEGGEALSTVEGALARREEVWVCLPLASLLALLSWASHLISPVLHLYNWSGAWLPVIT